MKPSIGRIVHYVSYGTPGGEYKSECRAAVVTEIDPMGDESNQPTVGLCVMNPTGLFLNQGVPYDAAPEGRRGGTWHWPERTEG